MFGTQGLLTSRELDIIKGVAIELEKFNRSKDLSNIKSTIEQLVTVNKQVVEQNAYLTRQNIELQQLMREFLLKMSEFMNQEVSVRNVDYSKTQIDGNDSSKIVTSEDNKTTFELEKIKKMKLEPEKLKCTIIYDNNKRLLF